MKKIIIILFVLTGYKSIAQFFIMPSYSSFYSRNTTNKDNPFLISPYVKMYDPAVGLRLGYKRNKIEYGIGYFYYRQWTKVSYEGYYKNNRLDGRSGTGSSFFDGHDFSFEGRYNLLNYKRLRIYSGINIHRLFSQRTAYYGNKQPNETYQYLIKYTSPSTSTDTINILVTHSNTGYDGWQFMFEPTIDIEIKVFRKTYFNFHFGYIFGTKDVYFSELKFAEDDLPVTTGYSRFRGGGFFPAVGIKHILVSKNQKLKRYRLLK